MGLIAVLCVGAIAGWLAGQILKGKGFGLVGNIVVGIVGAFVGDFIFGFFGIGGEGLLFSILSATLGAVVLLYLVSLFKKA